MQPCVFLDRDNTIIANDGDLGDPSLVRLIDGAAWGIRAMREAGYLVVVVSNQGGVARGKYAASDVVRVQARVDELLARAAQWTGDAPLITQWMFCPYHPDGTVAAFRKEHPWRKPAPGMLLDAATSLAIDLKSSWMVGDQERDVDAGRAAGCKTIRISATASVDAEVRASSGADFIESDLLHASHRIVRVDGHDGAPTWKETHCARILALPGRLSEAQTRELVRVTAHALAERAGVHIAQITIDEDGVAFEVVGAEIVALGFAAELRRSTTHWAAAHGVDPLWVSG
ncbi:MAG: HAD-IIIA family hydrolase [Phycisphaerales bacterium]|nr:HAD-IIIA family hydrolase [Phycisphaerales bacterium]